MIFRFNSRRNPTPASFTHNTRIEIAWTLIPVVILIVIGSFSLPILFKQLEVPTPDLTVKATGNQWYWSYYYPENDFTFDSLMLAEDDLAAHGYPPESYLLAADTALVVPVDKVVHVLVTGADVIHSFTVPGLRDQDRRGARAAQRDLVQGRGGGHLLRPVLGALRQEPQLHADHRQGGEPGGLRRLAGLGDRRVRRHPAGSARGRRGRRRRPGCRRGARGDRGARRDGRSPLRPRSPLRRKPAATDEPAATEAPAARRAAAPKPPPRTPAAAPRRRPRRSLPRPRSLLRLRRPSRPRRRKRRRPSRPAN